MRMNYDLSTFRKNFEIFQLQIAPREGKRFSEPDRHYLWRLQKSTIDWSGPFLGWRVFRVSLVCSCQQWFGGYFLWFLLIIIFFLCLRAFLVFTNSCILSLMVEFFASNCKQDDQNVAGSIFWILCIGKHVLRTQLWETPCLVHLKLVRKKHRSKFSKG